MSVFSIVIKSVSSQSKNLKNGFLYFAPSLVAMLGAMFTMPIYSKYLTAGDFGLIAYFGSVSQLFLPVSAFGLTSFYLYKYFRVDPEDQKRVFRDLFKILTAINLILMPIALGLVVYFFKVLSISYPALPFILIVLVNLLFDAYYTLFLIDFRLKKQGLSYFIFSGSTTIFSIIFGLSFVTVFQFGPAGKMIGPLIARIIITCVLLVFSYFKSSDISISSVFKIEIVNLRELVKFVIPVILANYASYPFQNIDRIFLERLKNPTEFGLYAIGITFYGILNTLSIAVFQAFEPDLYKMYAEKKKKKYMQLSAIYLSMIAVMIAGFILFSRIIVGVLTNGRFLGSVVYANINVFSILFMRIGGFIEIMFVAKAKTNLLLYKNIIIGLMSIVVYKFMIDALGFRGGNFARVITAILYPAVCYSLLYFSKKHRSNRINYVQ